MTTTPPDTPDYALREEVPSLEEILAQAPLLWGGAGAPTLAPGAATGSTPLFIAPFPIRLLSLQLAFAGYVAPSTTNYWTLVLRKSPTGPPGAVDVATRDTQQAGLANRGSFGFDTGIWNPTNRQLAAGDVVWITATPTGVPASLAGGLATFRYARQ